MTRLRAGWLRAAAQLQAHISDKPAPTILFAALAAMLAAAQCAGLALAVQRVGCELGRNTTPDAAACRGEAFLVALAVPGVPGYEVWDDVLFGLSVGLVGSIVAAAAAWNAS